MKRVNGHFAPYTIDVVVQSRCAFYIIEVDHSVYKLSASILISLQLENIQFFLSKTFLSYCFMIPSIARSGEKKNHLII